MSSANCRTARACTPSRATCSACSARCRARALSGGICRPMLSRPMPASVSCATRWRWSVDTRFAIYAHRSGVTFARGVGPGRLRETPRCSEFLRASLHARAAHRRRRACHRIARRIVRCRRRRRDRAGSLRDFPRDAGARRRAHAALRRHVARDHHPDLDPFVSCASRKKRDLPVDILRQWAVPVDGRRADRRGDRRLRPGVDFQDRLCGDRALDRGEIPVRKRELEARRSIAGSVPDECLWPHHRALFGADGRRRRVGVERRSSSSTASRSMPRSALPPASAF